MNWQAYRHTRKGVGFSVAASAALAAFGAAAAPAMAQSNDATQSTPSGVNVSILSPLQSSSFEGAKKIEISAFYEAPSSGVQSVELDIDGVKAASKTLDAPELKGIISFLVDPTTLATGDHKILIRAFSADGDEAVANTGFHYTGDTAGIAAAGGIDANPAAPRLSIESISDNQKVNGIVTITIAVHDPSGRSPYVSLFIDNVFKTLRNYGPYTFEWDTTRVGNGLHTISVTGFTDENQIGKSAPIHVFVNNVMGDTPIQSGLTDTVAAPARIAPPAIKSAPTPDILGIPDAAPVLPEPVGDAALAASHGSVSITGGRMPDQLASVDLQDHGIAAETWLNAPFLNRKAPVTPDEIVPNIAASLAAPAQAAVPQYSHGVQRLASASVDADDLSAEAYLSPPALKAQLAPTAAPTPSDIVPPTIADHVPVVAPVVQAAPVHASPVHASPVHASPVDAAQAAPVHPRVVASRAQPKSSAAPGSLGAHPGAPRPIEASATKEHLAKPEATAAVAPKAAHPKLTLAAPPVATHVATTSMTAPVGAPQIAPAPVTVKVHVAAPRYQMASASIDGRLGGSVLKAPVLVPQARPAHRNALDITGAVHHTVTVFSKPVMERLRGSYCVVMDDHMVRLDQPIQNRHHVLYAPLRSIFESRGENVQWLPAAKEIRVATPRGEVVLKIGSHIATINGQAMHMDTAPYVSHSRTMIPVGFLPAALNVTVGYDQSSGRLMINRHA